MALNNKSQFLEWIHMHIKINNLKENKDYFLENVEVGFKKEMKQERKDYLLTQEACAKIVASQKRNSIAKNITEELKKEIPIHNIIDKILTANNQEIQIVKITDEEYPDILKKIKDPPQQLYVKGNIENLKKLGIAVIGSRHCSNYGRKISKIFTNNLVGYDLNIISGLACGIDTCAHKACIKSKGKTIAVLPSGFNNIYPKENEKLLYEIIKEGGTVVTEYPPEFEKNQESCKSRNRIMSGLAIATLVIEAEKRSGTSITVRHTNEQNKKAFCIPSSIENSKGIGTNEMIKNGQAKLVTKVEDIIKELQEFKLERKQDFSFISIVQKESKKSKEKNVLKIDEENLEIYNLLTKTPKTIDEIVESVNTPIDEITYKLTLLELQGAIEKLPGKKFKIK